MWDLACLESMESSFRDNDGNWSVTIQPLIKFGFIGGLKIKIVGADVLDGPMPTREDSLSGKGYLRGVEDCTV